MDYEKVVEEVGKEVRGILISDATGHDWLHIERVLNLSKKIRKNEGVGSDIEINLIALLHDVSDWKFNENNDKLNEMLNKYLGHDRKLVKKIFDDIKNISYRGSKVKRKKLSVEAEIVWDADKLDALGAIGIARCFATGAKFGRPIYDPEVLPKLHRSFKEYRESLNDGTSINHFYEKLLLLEDRMYTASGKTEAKKRTKFLRTFLKNFNRETLI